MSARSSLDDMISSAIADASGDPARLQDLTAALVSGLGLTIAMSAAGDRLRVGVICEDMAVHVYRQAERLSAVARMARGRA
ncbi:hypothetical protein [Methylobacterium organophilum]|uniref:Uncharacterized protein n=1 Tax=Methylobacterium organophilum TaxID=410 RepID=A0ABQ4THY7_METOR|nr:hypothetical protein [Methylobacterium organophilum]GJE29755.1 hypothetical protein LKMONMHP_4641 [Methylobacterium organophilum]